MFGDRIDAAQRQADREQAAQRADRIAELGHERESLRLLATFERDAAMRGFMLDLMDALCNEMLFLRADPCGVLGRIEAGMSIRPARGY